MQAIRDLVEIRADAVLYHSAFGFARVKDVANGEVQLAWERPADGLPARVKIEGLVRAYRLCRPDGFFDRALRGPDALREALEVDPVGTLHVLLDELDGPQRKEDVRDWVVGRELISARAFDRWWDRLGPLLREDGRFRVVDGAIALDPEAQSGPWLDDPTLPPSRRLELAIADRAAIEPDTFLRHVAEAWRNGGPRVRDAALEQLREQPADVVFGALLGADEAHGLDATEALIHAVRQGAWSPMALSEPLRGRLVARAANPRRTPDDVDGRLVAALWRWGVPGLVPGLIVGAPVAVVHAALSALPPRRSEALGTAILTEAITERAEAVALEVARRLVADTPESVDTWIDRVSAERPAVREFLIARRASLEPVEIDAVDQTEDIELPTTAEITRDAPGPIGWESLPHRMDRALLDVGAALARALARHHALGRVVNPSRETVQLLPDGTVFVIEGGDPRRSYRPTGEPPSPASDVFAGAVLLVEAILGRPWPRALPPDKAMPFLRHVAPGLPPSALGPLARGLHPQAKFRAGDGQAWLGSWIASGRAEEARTPELYSPRVRVRVGFDSHVGRAKLLQTQTNQDAVFVSTKGPLSLFVVCDGISTANTGSGDLAAAITTQVVASLWEQWLSRLVNARHDEARDFVDRALRTANQAVCEASLRLAGGRLQGRVPMGTTAIVGIGVGNRVSIGWLGDSRAYVVGPYGAAQLTADLNQAGERVVDWVEGKGPPWDGGGFALVGYVGHFDELGAAVPLGCHHTSIVLHADERLVMCSDGVTDYAGEGPADAARALSEIAAHGDPEEAARRLIDAANRGGGGDNATAIVVTPGAS